MIVQSEIFRLCGVRCCRLHFRCDSVNRKIRHASRIELFVIGKHDPDDPAELSRRGNDRSARSVSALQHVVTLHQPVFSSSTFIPDHTHDNLYQRCTQFLWTSNRWFSPKMITDDEARSGCIIFVCVVESKPLIAREISFLSRIRYLQRGCDLFAAFGSIARIYCVRVHYYQSVHGRVIYGTELLKHFRFFALKQRRSDIECFADKLLTIIVGEDVMIVYIIVPEFNRIKWKYCVFQKPFHPVYNYQVSHTTICFFLAPLEAVSLLGKRYCCLFV